MNIEYKARENHCRRWAKKLGLRLHKSRARGSIDNLGGYMIIEVYQNLLLSGERFNLDLDNVEKFLENYERRLSA